MGGKVIRFIETFGVFSNMKWTGQRFVLQPWQKKMLMELFEVNPETGLRRFRRALVGIPRKNGKTELAAILALYLTLADGERSSQVYCAAASEDQANFVFEAAKRMCSMKVDNGKGGEMDAPLASLVTVEASKITANHDPYSFFQRLSSKGSTKHGSGPHGVIFDELHAWGVGEAAELWDALNTGSAARDQPLQISITTAGTDLEESRCGGLYLHGKAVERGEIDDPGFFFRWWEAPEGCDYRDPEMWKLASPNYGVSVNANFLAGELAGTNAVEGQAKGAAVSEAAFRRLYLNQWIDFGETPWVTKPQLKPCRVTAFLHEYQAPTWVGVDLSRSEDSTAVCWGQWVTGGPCGHTGEPCLYVKARTWERPRKPDGKFDEEWRVPLPEVRQFIRDLNAEFSVPVNVFDPYGAQLMKLDLEAEGIVCELMHQQGLKRSSAATGMYDLIVAERFHFEGDTLERHILNATIKATGEDGYYLQKRRKGKIMDAAQAASHVVYGTIYQEAVETMGGFFA
jgi:phage terminase large subunit-like protein